MGTSTRPEPPADMSPAEVAMWNRIIATMPAGFFTADNAFILRAMVVGALAEQKGETR
jgi:hypothetical protein